MAKKEIAKQYNPHQVEEKWYRIWEENGYFLPQGDGPAFTISMPPPNITGKLHMGHALNNTLQDILTRQKRMAGYKTLWLPGTDHASIATETKVVAALASEGKSKEEIGREAFLERVWQWKEEYGGTITQQLRRLGCSCDWSRERFTMDEGLNRAITEVFVRLYEEGLIYRGDYSINWCPECRTTLSDIEVEHEETEGALYHIRYPLLEEEGALIIATTRPETMLGDTAVAVHPEDERYASYVGKTICLPLMERHIPVIADAYVDPQFGTGALKVTPGHDPNDFDMGQRHNLPMEHVIDEEGKMTEAAGVYAGLDRFTCREKVVADLQKQGYLIKKEKHVHGVGHCYRCDTTVEPLVSRQWFVQMKPLAGPAIDVVDEGDVRFVPERFTRIYKRWLEEIRDWCISRQLWWGHRIPVWYCDDCGEEIVTREEPSCCPTCDRTNLTQDPDVLDTWFSSALWPFSTLGWPEETEDLKTFFPTSVLITGPDIIFFWVARMIFSSLKFMDQAPFQDVLINGLVRDSQGQKMSKSSGTGVDPMDLIEVSGADALRFALVIGVTMGNDTRIREERVEAARNFTNKLWNALRFFHLNLEDFDPRNRDIVPRTLAQRWIVSRLQKTNAFMDQSMKDYRFNEFAQSIYDFTWNEYCDWYIEMAKEDLYSEDEGRTQETLTILWYVLERLLRLLHPVMPHISEEIWHHIPHDGDTIMQASWPVMEEHLVDIEAENHMEWLQGVIKAIRNVRQELEIPPQRKITAYITPSEELYDMFHEGAQDIKSLARVGELHVQKPGQDLPEHSISTVFRGVEINLPLAGLMNLQEEAQRLEKEKEKLEKELQRVDRQLANEGFLAKAPEHLIEGERKKREEYRDSYEKITQRLTQVKQALQN